MVLGKTYTGGDCAQVYHWQSSDQQTGDWLQTNQKRKVAYLSLVDSVFSASSSFSGSSQPFLSATGRGILPLLPLDRFMVERRLPFGEPIKISQSHGSGLFATDSANYRFCIFILTMSRVRKSVTFPCATALTQLLQRKGVLFSSLWSRRGHAPRLPPHRDNPPFSTPRRKAHHLV